VMEAAGTAVGKAGRAAVMEAAAMVVVAMAEAMVVGAMVGGAMVVALAEVVAVDAERLFLVGRVVGWG